MYFLIDATLFVKTLGMQRIHMFMFIYEYVIIVVDAMAICPNSGGQKTNPKFFWMRSAALSHIDIRYKGLTFILSSNNCERICMLYTLKEEHKPLYSEYIFISILLIVYSEV